MTLLDSKSGGNVATLAALGSALLLLPGASAHGFLAVPAARNHQGAGGNSAVPINYCEHCKSRTINERSDVY